MKGPFNFQISDINFHRLILGAQHTLDHFHQWRDSNPERVAWQIRQYTRHTHSIARDLSLLAPRPEGQSDTPARRTHLEREFTYFAIYNLAEIPAPGVVTQVSAQTPTGLVDLPDEVARAYASHGVEGAVDLLKLRYPLLREVPETDWVAERFEHLHRTLPERVVREGSLGKVVRTLAGIVAIGAYDTYAASHRTQLAHLRTVIPGAYTMGAAYAIVDDAFQDAPEGYFSAADRENCHRLIVKGLTSGCEISESEIPDHPLAEELHWLYERMLRTRPFDEWRHLYEGAAAMYLAQDLDARTPVESAHSTERYPHIFVKAAMSRVLANIIGRRRLSSGFYRRCVNTIFLSQLRDDFKDRAADLRAGQPTPFTLARRGSDSNPLYDLFAYEAYVTSQIYGDNALVAECLPYFGARSVSPHLAANPDNAEDIIAEYDATPEIAEYVRTAVTELSGRPAQRALPLDKRFTRSTAEASTRIPRTAVDVRTFIADHAGYINRVVGAYNPAPDGDNLSQVTSYILDAPAKRLRASLTLMLATSLDVAHEHIEPLLAAEEMLHTASLVFDDLPAQDNATMRRGRPAAHTVFDEGSTQLSGIALISRAFTLISELSASFPPARVIDVLTYVGTMLGDQRMCRGQDIDLRMARGEVAADRAAILEMYRLKTSSAIEAAVVPLTLLLGRPREETELLARYADSAGIVFQIRDDMLDLTSTARALGKHPHQDAQRANIVRTIGLEQARTIMDEEVHAAVARCQRLPFDTAMLESAVTHFARRRR